MTTTTFVWPLTRAALDDFTIVGALADDLEAVLASLVALPALSRGDLVSPLAVELSDIIVAYELDEPIVVELDAIVLVLVRALLNEQTFGHAPTPGTQAVDLIHDYRVAHNEVR